MKKINRNAFNEKLIHRYLFERYYFSDLRKRNRLLPERFSSSEINLVVPEENKATHGYRADLSIYFKNNRNAIPVEIKWSIKDFNKENQINYLKNNNGFIVAFDSIDKDKFKGVDYIQIDYNDFKEWIANSISKLTRETLIYQANITEAAEGNQFWVVFLRGSAHLNFYRMLKDSPKNTFWAFKQNRHALKNIFDMQKGDMCLFILGSADEGMGMSNDPNLKCEFSAWYVTKIKEPYYMVLKGDKGTFFEDGKIPINQRRWPHFMDFNILDYFESKEKIQFGQRGEFSKPFADSYNHGAGAPAPLLRRQWDELIDRLKAISPKEIDSNRSSKFKKTILNY